MNQASCKHRTTQLKVTDVSYLFDTGEPIAISVVCRKCDELWILTRRPTHPVLNLPYRTPTTAAAT